MPRGGPETHPLAAGLLGAVPPMSVFCRRLERRIDQQVGPGTVPWDRHGYPATNGSERDFV